MPPRRKSGAARKKKNKGKQAEQGEPVLGQEVEDAKVAAEEAEGQADERPASEEVKEDAPAEAAEAQAEAAPAAEEAPAVEDPVAVEEPAAEEQPAEPKPEPEPQPEPAAEKVAVEEVPAAADEPAVEESVVAQEPAPEPEPEAATEQQPVEEEAPAAVEEPAVEESVVGEEQPAAEPEPEPEPEPTVEEAPIAEEQPAVDEAPAVEEQSVVEEAPATVEEPAVLEQPAAEPEPEPEPTAGETPAAEPAVEEAAPAAVAAADVSPQDETASLPTQSSAATPSMADVDLETKVPQPSSADSEKRVFFHKRAWSNRFGPKFYTAWVEGYELEAEDCLLPVPYYLINVRCGNDSWVVRHRYSDFDALVRELQEAFPDKQDLFRKALPPKTPLGIRFVDPKFINTRAEALNEFLEQTLQQEGVGDLLQVREFLQLDSREH